MAKDTIASEKDLGATLEPEEALLDEEKTTKKQKGRRKQEVMENELIDEKIEEEKPKKTRTTRSKKVQEETLLASEPEEVKELARSDLQETEGSSSAQDLLDEPLSEVEKEEVEEVEKDEVKPSARTKPGSGPSMAELEDMTLVELQREARELGVAGYSSLRKKELIFEILKAKTQAGGLIFAEGLLEILNEGYGFLRPAFYFPSKDDIYISPSQIR